jgi:hypothetical protein
MIISASYKTDLPAFYGEWLMNRIRAGYCKMVNPFNRHQHSTISLARDDVDGIVFWTKNLGPFLKHLPEIRDKGFPFIVQYTINAYPRKLEFSVTDPVRAIAHVKGVVSEYGPQSVVWRYDPVVLSSETPVESHIENFSWISSKLKGYTNEVVVSFAQIYRKTQINMNNAAKEYGFEWRDPGDDEKRSLLKQLAEVARESGMLLSVCSQPHLLEPGLAEAHCVDAKRLTAISGCSISAALKGSRKECGCFESRDIGDYDTCPHGCVYCYAVRNRELAKRNFIQHDPLGEYLFPPTQKTPDEPQKELFQIE